MCLNLWLQGCSPRPAFSWCVCCSSALSITVLLCLRCVEPHVLAGALTVLSRLMKGRSRPLPVLPVICIFIAAVPSSVNTPLTPRADPAPNGSTLLSHLKWGCPLLPGFAAAETQAPVDLAFWDGNGVSSHVNVDFPLGKMIDLCCAVAVNRKWTGTIKWWNCSLCAGEACVWTRLWLN